MNHQATNLHEKDSFPQSVVYAYPPAMGATDEINLGDLLSKLIGQWKLMAVITVVGGLLSIAVALIIPRVYQVDTTLSLPTQADIAPFNTNGLNVGSTKELFKRYYNKVRSINQISMYIAGNNYLSRLFPDSTDSQSQMMASIADSFSVKVDEPLPQKRGDLVEWPERITVELVHENETLIAELLAGYIAGVADSLITSIEKEQRVVVEGKIQQLEKKIEVLRIRAEKTRLNEISRLKAENSEKINSLKRQIEASITEAASNTQNRLVQIHESRAVAESLGIVYPTELKEIKGQDAQNDRLQTLIQVNDNESLPLFLMGTRYLDSLIASIKDRKNEAAFVDNINDMRKQIVLLEHDATLEALMARDSNDPYIPEVPDIQANIAELKALSLDFSAAKVYTLEKEALITGEPIKPNRKLIVVLGVILSGMLALLIGVIVVSVNNRESSNTR